MAYWWSVQKHIFTMECFYHRRSTSNLMWVQWWPCQRTSHKMKKYVVSHTFNAGLKDTGRMRTVSTPENVERVRVVLGQSPCHFARRRALSLNLASLSSSSWSHLSSIQDSNHAGIVWTWKVGPVRFSQPVQDVMQQDPLVLDMLCRSDEADFLLSVFVNEQNYHNWAETTWQTSMNYRYMQKWLLFVMLLAQSASMGRTSPRMQMFVQ